jgi:hypothetical protein
MREYTHIFFLLFFVYIHMSNCISRRDDLTIGRR